MRIQSSHKHAVRGLDPYFTPIEATKALMAIEKLPQVIWEPACGDGAIVKPLRRAGHKVIASDIFNYGFRCRKADYLSIDTDADGIVTNPPYKLAIQFVEKSLRYGYSAFLLRTNFLESIGRKDFFETFPPSRIWISSRRLPMMHRYGWKGNKTSSNTAYAWFIWDASVKKRQVHWFDWADYD